MAKKSRKNQQGKISPGKYFQTRVRQLPIFECLVIRDWETSRNPLVMISRRHASGKFSFAFYLVDLYCMGVVFTDYGFNIPIEEYEKSKEIIFQTENDFKFKKVNYTLAHNIIYAGVEYAAEFGINPHKDFAVTQFMLKEDDDSVKLIDIECGKDGKPLFISQIIADIPKFGNQQTIIDKLEKTVGKDGYIYIQNIENLEDLKGAEEVFFDKDLEEDKRLFQKHYPLKPDMPEEDLLEIMNTTGKLAYAMADYDILDDYYDLVFDVDIDNILFDTLPGELLKEPTESADIHQKANELIDWISSRINKKPRGIRKKLKELEHLIPGSPLINYFEIVFNELHNKDKNKLLEVIFTARREHPDSGLIKLMEKKHVFLAKEKQSFRRSDRFKMSNFFAGRSSLHFTELTTWFNLLMIAIIESDDNIEEKLAFIKYIEDWKNKVVNQPDFLLPERLIMISSTMNDLNDILG